MKREINLVKALDIAVTAIGIIMIGIGLFMIFPPAMFIAIGLILSFPQIPRKKVK